MNPKTGSVDGVNAPASPGLLSPEYRVLLLCSRAALDVAQRGEVSSLLAQSLRWDYLLQQAARHGLMPLLSRHLERFGDAVPHQVSAELKSHLTENTRRNLALVSTLFAILDVLENAGIAAVPYKGPALSDSLYRHLGSRECADLDVLVQAKDALRAKRALQSIGLAEVFPASDVQNASRIRAGEAFEFIADNGALIELQWQPLPRAWSADIGEDHWGRLQSQDFAGRRVRSFAPEDLLLILALHGAKHAWQRFIWVADIHELAGRNKDMNWHGVLAHANAAGARRCVLLALKLSNMLLDTNLPDPVASAIADDSGLSKLARDAIRMATAQETVLSAISAHGYFLRTRERPLDRARFYLRFATTAGYHEWNLIRLPAPLFPLYSVVRMLRVAGKMVWNPYSSPLS